jgi:hypothetical protein
MHSSKLEWSAASIASRLLIVNLVAWICSTGTAIAHPEFSPTTTNRYVKLTLLGANELRLAYTVMYGAQPAWAERQAADSNHDGRVDESESRALGARLQREVTRALVLTVDGQRVEPRFEEPQVGLAGDAVGPSAFSVDLIARVAAPGPGTHEVRFDDATPLPELGESEIRLEESPATRLVEAHRGASGHERETRFVFRGPKATSLEDRSITFRFTGSAPTPAPASASGSRTTTLALLVGAALAAIALTTIVLKTRRRGDTE